MLIKKNEAKLNTDKHNNKASKKIRRDKTREPDTASKTMHEIIYREPSALCRFAETCLAFLAKDCRKANWKCFDARNLTFTVLSGKAWFGKQC